MEEPSMNRRRLPGISLYLWIITSYILFSFSHTLATPSPGFFLSTPDGKVLMEQNAHEDYVPASILKILTGFAALSHFGKDHRFPTAAYFDESASTLYIKGFGDPLFISEAILQFSNNIYRYMSGGNHSQSGSLKHIVLDQNFFAPDIHIPGAGRSANPYDAAVGALCANFNTVSFQKSAAGQYISAEPQTPLFPEFLPCIKATGTSQGRILIPKALQPIYPGMLIEYFLSQKGIRTTAPKCTISTGTFPKYPTGKTLVFSSPFSLEEVVQKLLRYSNNLIANHILLAMGADQYREPATVEKGIRALKAFAKKQMGMELPLIFEGSGLSGKNKITPAQMGKILMHFDPWYGLLRENEHTYYKTGTLTGVRCLAGYIKGKKGARFPFVIMVNQPKPDAVNKIVNKLINRVKSHEAKNSL